jgi:hypothetical protein
MPISHQLNINTNFVSNPSAVFNLDTPIGIIGIAETATFPINTITKIRNDVDLTILGGITDNTILPEVKILQEYGCRNIYIIRVTKGATPTDTETNVIGTETPLLKTGLGLFKECFTRFKEHLEFVLIPGLNSAAIVTKALDVASFIDAFICLDFPVGSTTTSVTTTRGTSTGLGTKNTKLLTFVPRIKRGVNLESLATHSVAVIAAKTYREGYGYSSSNELFVKPIDGVEAGWTASYTDVLADNQKMERLGVMSFNSNAYGYSSWGNRNSLYVDSVVESIDTYYVVQRIKQKLNYRLTQCSALFLDESCTLGTAKLLESALNNIIYDNISFGNLKAQSRAIFNESASSFTLRSLVYDISIGVNLPTEVITINLQYSIQL